VEVEMGQEDVQGLLHRPQRGPEASNAGAGVEHENAAIWKRELHARGVPPVARGLRPRRGNGAARAPDLDLHSAASSIGQKKTIAPRKPSTPTIGSPLASIFRSAPLSERMR